MVNNRHFTFFFTNCILELKKYGKENNQDEEEFIAEQYELNSNIFRRNFSLIIQSIGK